MKDTLPPPAAGKPALYFTVWRWHFYAGLIVAPFAIFLALTGAIYLFKTEIEEYLHPDWMFVEAGAGAEGTVSADTLVNSAANLFSGSHPTLFAPPAANGRSAEVQTIDAKGQLQIVYLHPRTGAVRGSTPAADRFTEVVRQLHGKLLAGKAGQVFVEWVACWAFVLLITGLYLWWPRPAFSVWGTFLPRLRQGGRAMLRDLHSIPAMYLSGFVLFLIVTGLPWAVVGAFQVQMLQAAFGENNPPDLRFFWPAPSHEHAPTPQPVPENWLERQPHGESTPTKSAMSAGMARIPLQSVVEKTKSLPPGAYEIRIPQTPDGVFLISERATDPRNKVLVYVDQYSGTVLGDYRWNDFGPVARYVSLGIAIHEGRFFGWPNQLLGLITACGLTISIVFGATLWWRRRPKGRLGTPRTPANARTARIVVALVALCGIVMPLVGASLLPIVLLDRLILSRSVRWKAIA